MPTLTCNTFKQSSYLRYLQPLIILLFAAGNLLWGEILPVDEGFGWDGGVYEELTKDYQKDFSERSFQPYYLQRILPSVIVRSELRLARAQLSRQNVLLAFRIYDAAVLVAAAFAWALVMECLRFSYRDKWLGFVLMFLNYAFLKEFFYCPVATDQTAFALATFILLFFLKGNQIGLFLSVLAAAYTWPILMFTGILLYLFPRRDEAVVQVKRSHSVILATLISFAFAAAAARAFFVDRLIPLSRAAPIVTSAIWISITIASAYLFLLYRFFLCQQPGFSSSEFNFRRFIFRLASAGVLIGGVALVSALFSKPSSAAILLHPFELIALSAISRPGIFLVANAVFWGPAILVAVFFWRRVAENFCRHGAGLFLFGLISALLTVGAESRQWISFFPFLIAMTTYAVARSSLATSAYWIIAAISLLYSKVWFLMNRVWSGHSTVPLRFPWQYLFMNLGPWMSNRMYLLQGMVVIITAVVLYFILQGRRQPRTPPQKIFFRAAASRDS